MLNSKDFLPPESPRKGEKRKQEGEGSKGSGVNRQIDASNQPSPSRLPADGDASTGKHSAGRPVSAHNPKGEQGRFFLKKSCQIETRFLLSSFTDPDQTTQSEEEEDDLSLSVSLPSGGGGAAGHGGGGGDEGDGTSEDSSDEEDKRKLFEVKKGILKILSTDEEEEGESAIKVSGNIIGANSSSWLHSANLLPADSPGI